MNSLVSLKVASRVLATLATITSLFFAAGCGSGSGFATGNPQGFSNSSLNGTYVFSTSGNDSVNGVFLSLTGTFQADGNGNIASNGGTLDVNGLSTGPSTAVITGGSYKITSDGRGQVQLTSASSVLGGATLDFVLMSSSHGLVTEFDGDGTGSGTIDLQNSPSTQGSYSFLFSGASVSGGNEIPFAMAGSFTLNGTSITGVADVVDDGISIGAESDLTLSGSLNAGSATTPGTAIFVASSQTSSQTFLFDVYAIDSTHLKFIETDSLPLPVMAGDAFTQQTSIPSGVMAYTMNGIDLSGNPLALGGFITGSSNNTITNGFEDYNDAGVVPSTPVTGFAGSYSTFAGGRTVLTLNGIYNGNGTVNVDFAAYPSSGGLLLLEIDNAGFTSGTAFAQSATSFSSSQGYGLNLSAANAGGYEEDDIAEFKVTGSNLTGVIDINDNQNGQAQGQTFTGSYTPDSTTAGHGSATTNSFNFNYYVVNSSTVLLLETDDNQVGIGSFIGQNSTQGAGAVSTRAIVRLKPAARGAWAKRKK